MIYTVGTNSYCQYRYNYGSHVDTVALKLNRLDRGNTYITVLCLNSGYAYNPQKSIAALLEASKDIKILYKSPLAVNKNPNHGKQGRNCTYVFYYPALCELAAANAPDVQTEVKTVAETIS